MSIRRTYTLRDTRSWPHLGERRTCRRRSRRSTRRRVHDRPPRPSRSLGESVVDQMGEREKSPGAVDVRCRFVAHDPSRCTQHPAHPSDRSAHDHVTIGPRSSADDTPGGGGRWSPVRGVARNVDRLAPDVRAARGRRLGRLDRLERVPRRPRVVVRDRLGDREDRFFARVMFGSGLLYLAMLSAAAALSVALVRTSDAAEEVRRSHQAVGLLDREPRDHCGDRVDVEQQGAGELHDCCPPQQSPG